MAFGWFNPEGREQRKKVRLDRKHLAARSRRFLRNYLNADDRQKPGYYRVVVNASAECRPKSALSSTSTNDAEIAEVTSDAALTVVLERVRVKKNDRADDFVTDASATVGVAYHRRAVLGRQNDAEVGDGGGPPSHHGDIVHGWPIRLRQAVSLLKVTIR